MSDKNIFDFTNDEYYQLMLDMVKENHADGEEEDIINRYGSVDNLKLFRILNEHELAGTAGAYALSLGLSLCDEWQKEYERQKKHQGFLKSKSAEICSVMAENGIKMVILKNGGIMHSIIDEAVKCPMEDIDSLVSAKDFYKAHDILSKEGFVFKFRSEYEKEKLDEAFRDGSTEYYFMTPEGEKMWFELAWRPVAGRWIRLDKEPDTDELMQRAVKVSGSDVYVLSPEDNLLQVCVHTAKHSYVRAPGLRLHTDVDRIVSHNDIDWELFLKKVEETHVKTSTYLSLYIPSVLFGTAIPASVLNSLRPKNADRLLDMLAEAELIHPKEKKFSKFAFLRFQTALYDSKKDMMRVIYPGTEIMKKRYNCSNCFAIGWHTVLRTFDLIGVRFKK